MVGQERLGVEALPRVVEPLASFAGHQKEPLVVLEQRGLELEESVPHGVRVEPHVVLDI